MKCRKKKNYWRQDIPKQAYLKAILRGSGILLLTSYIFYDTWVTVLVLSPYLFWYIKSWETQYIKQEKRIFSMQFKDGIQAFSNALHVGYSAENALLETAKDLREIYSPNARMLREIEQMIRQIKMNITVETAMQDFAVRTQDEDVQTFVTAFNLAKRSGGDTLAIIRRVVRQMGEKIDVEREIHVLLAAKKMEFRVMTVIPYAMICYVKLSFPELTDRLYGNLTGILVMSGCLLLYGLAFEYGKHIVEIEV